MSGNITKSNTPKNILIEDFKSPSSIIFLIIITIILIMVLFYNFKLMNKMDSDKRTKILSTIVYVSIYVIFIGFYFLEWSFENVLIIIIVLSIIFSFISFLIIYFAVDSCRYIEKNDIKNSKIKILLVFLIFLSIYLGIYNKNIYNNWTIYDTVRVITMLISIRTIYYFVKKYNLQYYKTITDILTVIVLYFNGKRMYNILNT